MLELRGVTKRFSGIPAVDNVSFHRAPGRDHRLPGAERLRQIHHHEDDHRADRDDRRRDPVRRRSPSSAT